MVWGVVWPKKVWCATWKSTPAITPSSSATIRQS
jgi:hypothetical protein